MDGWMGGWEMYVLERINDEAEAGFIMFQVWGVCGGDSGMSPVVGDEQFPGTYHFLRMSLR